MIVVATEDFEVYHDVVAELRDRDATFTTVEPGDPLPERTSVLIVADEEVEAAVSRWPDLAPGDVDAGGGGAGAGRREADSEDHAGDAIELVGAEPGEARAAVEAALQLARGEDGRVVVGVDPGDRPGIAVLVGDTVVSAHQVPLAEVTDVVRAEVEAATDPVVRIGDGARLQGARLIEELEDVRVELVDETGTTPSLGTGASGLGDVLAAVNIARREGEAIEHREVEPTAGELQRIKDRSRERGSDNRAIDEGLARRVAAGELTVEEALQEHRSDAG